MKKTLNKNDQIKQTEQPSGGKKKEVEKIKKKRENAFGFRYFW